MGRRPKGAPPGPGAASRPVKMRLQPYDLERIRSEATAEGVTPSEHARDIVDAAISKLPSAQQLEEYQNFTIRFSPEQLDAISQSAAAAELEVSVWLRLILSRSGDSLLEQLLAARIRRKE